MKSAFSQLDAWLEAESKLAENKRVPQPPGSVTSTQYGAMMKLSRHQAAERLRNLYHAGLATREQWMDGRTQRLVYFLKKK